MLFLVVKGEMYNVCKDGSIHQNALKKILRISSLAKTKYFTPYLLFFFWTRYMDINTTHNEFSSFQYQYIMPLTTFIDYSHHTLSLPAWFIVVEIEIHFMTIRTPSLNKNYWPWRNTFYNFDRASITILVASNIF